MSNVSVTDLFQAAHGSLELSQQSLSALTIDPNLAASIQAGMGINPDDVLASEVINVGILLDDSGSIRFSGNTEAVRLGYNAILDAFAGAKQKGGTFIHTRYLNGFVLHPFRSVVGAPQLDRHNYNPGGGTPLYDQTEVMLATMLAKDLEFRQAGQTCRNLVLIVTDGADEHSTKYRGNPEGLKSLVTDLLATERHVVSAMGIEQPGTDFRKVFAAMGIPDNAILTSKSTASEIRATLGLWSQSAVRMSQTARSFSQAVAGGFSN